MDLIANILQRKQTIHNVLETTTQLLKDLILYEKLSTKEQFRDLSHPVVVKRCPTLAKVMDNSSYEYTIISELLPVIDQFRGEALPLTLPEIDKRTAILNQTYDFSLQMYDVRTLVTKPEEYVAVKESVHGIEFILLLTPYMNGLHAYILQCNEDYTLQTITPLSAKIGNDVIIINYYSSLGNNDHQFGSINGKGIRIQHDYLIVGDEHIPLDIATLALTPIAELPHYLLDIYRKGTVVCS